jgi:hypothetical protein
VIVLSLRRLSMPGRANLIDEGFCVNQIAPYFASKVRYTQKAHQGSDSLSFNRWLRSAEMSSHSRAMATGKRVISLQLQLPNTRSASATSHRPIDCGS